MLIYVNSERVLFIDFDTSKAQGISVIIYYIKGNLSYEVIRKILYSLRIKVKLIIFLSRTLKDTET